MGAGFSAACAQPPSTGLSDVPENCVAEVLMYLDPPQICNLARLSKTFHMASSADFVWESKLPSNYKFLVKKLLAEDPENLSKKEIYARLCQANSFDGANKVGRPLFFSFFLFFFSFPLFFNLNGFFYGGSGYRKFGWRRAMVEFALLFLGRL